jgi:hypothetical protein
MDGIGWVNAIIDAIVDGIYTGGSALLVVMVSNGNYVVPNKAALYAAGITGLVGAANQLRALRKQPR